MEKEIIIFISVGAVVIGVLVGWTLLYPDFPLQEEQGKENLQIRARNFVSLLGEEKFDEAERYLVDPSKFIIYLRESWENTIEKYGEMENIVKVWRSSQAIHVATQFENARLEIRVHFWDSLICNVYAPNTPLHVGVTRQ